MDRTRELDIYKLVKRLGLFAIVGIYLTYLIFYSADNGWQSINQDYYFTELWIATGVISGTLLVVSIADHMTTAPTQRSWRIYRSFIVSAVLSLGFFFFTWGIAVVDFASS